MNKVVEIDGHIIFVQALAGISPVFQSVNTTGFTLHFSNGRELHITRENMPWYKEQTKGSENDPSPEIAAKEVMTTLKNKFQDARDKICEPSEGDKVQVIKV